jgi:catechol 2,3-dioxygenase-like lactoylglutathione lyase family enzyme
LFFLLHEWPPQMTFDAPALVPELDVCDLDRSLAVYVGVFGFRSLFDRPEERFSYLVREGAHLMLEEASGLGRRFHMAPLDYPFGRGLNLQIQVSNVDALYADVQGSTMKILFPLEERWYRQNESEAGNRQFVVADPDGYILRFFQSRGRRPFQNL